MQWKPALSLVISAVFVFANSLPVASQDKKDAAEDQDSSRFSTHVPDSSVEKGGDAGLRGHTNHVIRVDPAKPGGQASPTGETPTSLRAVYNLPAISSGGGSGIIAVVDAYDYPTAENDLNVFSTQFGLPACSSSSGCFTKLYASGSKPAANGGWSQEAALDIEWAHALAPNARIVLVEANSNSFGDLFFAVDAASTFIAGHGGFGEVSMSWGGSEFSTESSYDSHMTHSGIVYFASSGDSGGATIYPGVSPNVVSAGGTSVNRGPSGTFVNETGWSGSGGGPSKYEAKPSYQNGVANTSSTHRSAPDFSFDANPNTGVAVYDSTVYERLSGWLVFGGTSVASPSLAGIVNNAGHFYSNTSLELTTIYSNYTNASDFRDIVSGKAGANNCTVGYDYVTGVGSDQGLAEK
jgi:kumamolisin